MGVKEIIKQNIKNNKKSKYYLRGKRREEQE